MIGSALRRLFDLISPRYVVVVKRGISGRQYICTARQRRDGRLDRLWPFARVEGG